MPPPPAIILVEPQLGENIGMSARAMANFSLEDLRIVAPRDGWPSEKAVSASAKATHIIDNAKIFATVKEAIADLQHVYAMTARVRDMIKPVMSPESAVGESVELETGGVRTGFMFGREKSGLTNDDISLCDAIVIAPVNPAFASLNLAQSVLLVGYEWLKCSDNAVLGRKTQFDGPGKEGMPGLSPAPKKDLAGFFEHLETELDKSGFLKPPEKRPAMVRNLRNMFMRMGATDQEVRTLRGIVASLTRKHERH